MKSLFLPRTWTPPVLAWSFLLLLPFARSSELPMFIMAILGGILLWKHGRAVAWESGAKIFSLLFLCIWVPIALSVPDSLWFKKSLSTALTFPRIWLAGLYLIWMLREPLARERLFKLSAWLLVFWVVDALIQAIVGYDLFGHAYPERLNGIYGPTNWKLGLTLAMLSPIVWEYFSRHGARWQLALAWLGTAAVVLLASNRESWIVFAVATVIWTWVYARRLGFSPLRFLLPIAVVTAIAGVTAYQVNPKLAQRVDLSAAALDFSYAGLETASSARMHLWSNAFRVIQSHPVNGSGARAFRYAYPEVAEPGDIFISPDGTGAIYAHQLLLEVGSETGLVGLAGLLAFLVILIRSSKGLSHHPIAWAAGLGAVAWLFPINTHTGLYSAYWSLLIGWLFAVSSARYGADLEH